jgi:hypothetical protein
MKLGHGFENRGDFKIKGPEPPELPERHDQEEAA